MCDPPLRGSHWDGGASRHDLGAEQRGQESTLFGARVAGRVIFLADSARFCAGCGVSYLCVHGHSTLTEDAGRIGAVANEQHWGCGACDRFAVHRDIHHGIIAGRWTQAGLSPRYDAIKEAYEKMLPLGRVCHPEDIAEDIAEGVMSLITGSSLVTGQTLTVDAGMMIAGYQVKYD